MDGQVSEGQLFRFFKAMRQEQRAAQWIWPWDQRRILAGEIEQDVKARLQGMGYRVSKTGHNERWDLWCEGVRVEVKASSWGGRYQANLRGNEADVLILGCVNGIVSYFVIPWEKLGDRRTVEVCSEDPEAYHGQWARWREAWGVVDDLVSDPPPNPWQMPLF